MNQKKGRFIMNEVSKAIIRLIVTAVLLVNATLTAKGINPIPFDANTFTEVATQVAAAIAVVWSWWKNNNITKAARYTQDSLNELKKIRVDDGEANLEEQFK